MGPTAVPGIPSRPLCRIQQLSILFPSWRRALRQVPNGSPANLQSATSRTPKPCPRGIKTPCSSKKICFFKTCAATETNLDKVQKSHLRPPPNRPLSLFLSPYHPRPHPLWWACRPGMHQPPPNTFSRRIANPRLSSSGPLFACPSSGLHLEFCKRSEAINSSCACHVVHFIKHPCLLTFSRSVSIYRQVVGGGEEVYATASHGAWRLFSCIHIQS